MVFKKIRQLVADQFGVDEDSITMDTSFEEDLGADSLDIVELTMSLEEEFSINEIDEDALAEISTVGDVVQLVSGLFAD